MSGVAVGLGSASRSTSSTHKRKSNKMGRIRAGKNIIVTSLLLQFGPK